MLVRVPGGGPAPHRGGVVLSPGARRIALLFAATIATAIGVHGFLHLPAVLGMMTGLGYLQLLDYFLQLRGRRRRLAESDYTFNVFHRLPAGGGGPLLFFFGALRGGGRRGRPGPL